MKVDAHDVTMKWFCVVNKSNENIDRAGALYPVYFPYAVNMVFDPSQVGMCLP